MSTDNGDLILCTLQLPKSQLAARKFLGSRFTDMQLADCILESLIKIAPEHCFGVTLANINR